MTEEGNSFQSLLRALDKDPQKAAEEYRLQHRRLVRFFALQAVRDPHRLADESLDRLGRRIVASPGEVKSPTAFLFGIARLILHEEERQQRQERSAAEQWASHTAESLADEESLLETVESCLAKMKQAQRELLLSYYRAAGRQKVDLHRRLAADLGLSLNALRNRLMRARRQLENCVRSSERDASRHGGTRR